MLARKRCGLTACGKYCKCACGSHTACCQQPPAGVWHVCRQQPRPYIYSNVYKHCIASPLCQPSPRPCLRIRGCSTPIKHSQGMIAQPTNQLHQQYSANLSSTYHHHTTAARAGLKHTNIHKACYRPQTCAKANKARHSHANSAHRERLATEQRLCVTKHLLGSCHQAHPQVIRPPRKPAATQLQIIRLSAMHCCMNRKYLPTVVAY
jgi:hypothetical protein